MKTVIIGSGPSGLFTAINAKDDNNEVAVLEKNNVLGKKILVTGSGKCNYWNDNQSIEKYHSRSSNEIDKIICDENLQSTLSILDEMIIPYIKDGYYYPFSREAASVRDILVNKCIEKGVVFKENYKVNKVEKINKKFIINDELEADKLVVSTGSLAYYQDENISGIEIAKSFGHKIIKPLPSLVQLVSNDKGLKDWEGVRSFAKVSLFSNGNIIKEEYGEVMLTNYGLSGICVMNLSNEANKLLDDNKEVNVHIDFAHNIDLDKIFKMNTDVNSALKSFLNSRLVRKILKESNIDNKKINELTQEEKDRLIDLITDYKVNIVTTKGFKEAQVVSGGVSLEDINLDNMESTLIPNLYFTGEVLDIDGDCGGYNLTISFVSGYLAGRDIKND